MKAQRAMFSGKYIFLMRLHKDKKKKNSYVFQGVGNGGVSGAGGNILGIRERNFNLEPHFLPWCVCVHGG